MKFINKDSLWIMFSNIIKLFFGLLIVPVISRNVVPSELGKLDLLLAYGPFINQLISMGFTNSSTKFYKENEDENVIRFMQSKIWLRSIIFVSVFFILFNVVSASKMGIPIAIVALYSISLFLENITFLPFNQLLNTNQFQKYSVYSTLSTIIRHSFTLLLVVLMPDKLLALSLGLLVSNLYLFIVNIKQFKAVLFSWSSKNLVSDAVIKNIKQYSVPLFFLGTVGILYQSSDRLLLAYFTKENMAQIGYLGMAQRIVGMLSVALSGLFTVWGIKAFENYSDDILMKEKEKLIWMMLLVFGVSILSMAVLKPLIIQYVLTTAYLQSFSICVLLVGTFANNRIREILEKFFLKKGKSKLISTIYIGFGVLSVLGSAGFLYFYSLEEMLMFRLIIAFLHSLFLYYLLVKEKQKLNPILFVLNLGLSVIVIFLIYIKIL